MKKVLFLSLLFFVGWCFGTSLNAQSCQPNPACKAVCTQMKAGTSRAAVAPAAQAQPVSSPVAYKKSCSGAAAKSGMAGVQVIPASLLDPGTITNTKALKNCDPTNCDPTNCDPSKCDWTKCDWRKCQPANCSGGGAKAKAVRL